MGSSEPGDVVHRIDRWQVHAVENEEIAWSPCAFSAWVGSRDISWYHVSYTIVSTWID